MSDENGRIALTRTSAGWFAHFTGPVAETIRFAFGTNTIPTAFTAEACGEDVQRDIQARWPRCIVTVQWRAY